MQRSTDGGLVGLGEGQRTGQKSKTKNAIDFNEKKAVCMRFCNYNNWIS